MSQRHHGGGPEPKEQMRDSPRRTYLSQRMSAEQLMSTSVPETVPLLIDCLFI